MTQRRGLLEDLLADTIFWTVIMRKICQCRVHSLGLSSLHSCNASLHIRNRTWKSVLNSPSESTMLCKCISCNISLAEGVSKPSRLRFTNFLCQELEKCSHGRYSITDFWIWIRFAEEQASKSLVFSAVRHHFCATEELVSNPVLICFQINYVTVSVPFFL
jgi:hypothetical protein